MKQVELTDAAVVSLLDASQHPEGEVFVARTLDFAGENGAHEVGVEQQHRQPLRKKLRLHPRVEAILTTGILSLRWDQDGRKIQLIH